MSRPRSVPPPPASRAALRQVLDPLAAVLGWLLSLRDARGRIVCPEHRVEHTGKSAYAISLALALRAHAQEPAERARLLEVAVQQAGRLVARLEREGTSPCHTFRPGRHDPFNCSNSVIDGGACSDALAELVRTVGAEIDPALREAARDACVLHARTYLRYAVLDKGIPAQRAWGLTGLAGAFALSGDAELERAALEAVGILEGIQLADGSYPYHPLEWGAGHIGASDVSAFYHSRIPGFLMHSLELLGRDAAGPLFAPPILRALEFLVALQGPRGIKCGLVEAKPWYWGATYEVASHPFDVHALARGHALFGRPRYGLAAARAFRAWVAHLAPDGRPQSHLPGTGRGRSYQCPLFWAAHAAWIARAAERVAHCLERFPDLREVHTGLPRSLEIEVAWFPEAQLVRLEDGAIVAWVRGARPGFNAMHGSPHGASLLQVVRKSDGAELIERCRLGGAQEAEWSGKAGGARLCAGWRAGKDELRFSFWLARVEARAGRVGRALAAPARMLERAVLAFASPRVSSCFALAPEVVLLPDGVELRSALAWRDGSVLAHSRVERSYRLDGSGLAVHERCVAGPELRALEYRVPHSATQVRRGPHEFSYRLA